MGNDESRDTYWTATNTDAGAWPAGAASFYGCIEADARPGGGSEGRRLS